MYHLDFRVKYEDTHNKLVQTMQINGVWPGHAESSETMHLVEGDNDVAVKVGPNYFKVWLNGVKYEESVVVDAARLSRYNSIIILQTGTCVTFGMEQSYTYTIWALASALAPSGKESPRKNENPVFYLIKKYYS